MTNATSPTTQAGKMAFIATLVTEFGEGAVLESKEILDFVHRTSNHKYMNQAFRHDPDYKLGRNQRLVTLSATPALERDKTAANMIKLAAKKEASLLPQETRKSATKLLAALGDVEVTKATKRATKPIYNENDAMEGFEHEEENINDLLAVISD